MRESGTAVCCEPVLADRVRLAGIGLSGPRESAHRWFRPVPESATLTRRWVGDVVAPLVDAGVGEATVLAASELATNAVVHARTPFQVGLTWWDDHLMVAVGDGNPGRPDPQPPDPGRASGRGLALVEALALHWGVAAEDRGKTTWLVLDRHPG